MSRWRSIVVLTAIAALAGGAWGCGSGDANPSANGSSAGLGATTTPAATGNLDSVTWALPYGEPTTLDWPQAGAYSENTVLAPLCESLLRISPQLGYENALAEKVEHPSPTQWVYRLRRGVRFTDGKPMTADDVVFSLKRNLDPNVGSFFSLGYANVSQISARDASTIVVTLRQPDVLFNEFMATVAGVVAEKAYVQRAGADYGHPRGGVMCTGPFKLKDWSAGKSITIERNDDYWDKAHLAKTGQIKFEFITNPSTLAAALTTGEVDGTYEAPVSIVDQVSSSGAGKLYLGASTELSLVTFTTRPGPLHDVRVRKALSLAVDRAAIASTVFKKTATPTLTPFGPASWGYAKGTFAAGAAELPDPTKTDVPAAKALIRQYGPVREQRLLVNADDTAATQLATYLQAQAKTVGIPIKIDALPAAQQIAAAFDPQRQKQYDMTISNSGYIDVPDPLEWVSLTLTPGALFNETHYDNPTVTKLTQQARASEDPQRRAELINRIAKQAYAVDYPDLMLANFSERLFLGKRVTGVPASLPSYIYYPWARDLGAAN